MPLRFRQKKRRVWAVLSLAAQKFSQIDGTSWAGAFAFNAFFSLFPLLVLLVTIASFFVNQERAGQEVISYMEDYVPLSGELQASIVDTVAGVAKSRQQAGIVALVMLIWAARQCFTSLIRATNRAWGTPGQRWWRLPLKSLLLLGITAGAVFLGIAVPVVMKMARDWLFPANFFLIWLSTLVSLVISMLILFFGLSLFYRLAPRRPTRFTEVWVAALSATILLQISETLFVLYLENFSNLNAVYGTFGGIMGLLLWIYLTGDIFIFGACLCAAQAENRAAGPETIATS